MTDAERIAVEQGVERAMRAFPDGTVQADARAELRFVLDAATRNVGIVYTPPYSLEPHKIVTAFLQIKELSAQISLAEAQTAIALYEHAGRPVPNGLHTKLAAAQLMAREVNAERSGAERFPVQLDDEAVRLFTQHMEKHAPAPVARTQTPGFDV